MLKPVLTFALALAFAAAPLLTPDFGGFAPDRYPVPQENHPVQPAGWAFAIWGVIYAWLVVHAGYGMLRRRGAGDWDPMRWPLIGSLAIGTTWLQVAQASPVWATLLIWLMWGGAVAAMIRAPVKDRWLGREPVALYAGWLTAASLVSTALLASGWGLLSQPVAAWAALAAALGLALTAWYARPTTAYAAGVGWALLGIWVANGLTAPLALAALAGAALMAVYAAKALRRDR